MRLRCGLLACFAQCGTGVKHGKYMINMQSHGFSYNLGIIELTKGIIALAIARAITLPVAHAIIPKLHSNSCDYLYKLPCVFTYNNKGPIRVENITDKPQ